MTDPARAAVLVDVRFESLTGRPYKLYALLDPALSNSGDDDVGEARGRTLVARDDEARLGAEDRARPDARVERLPGHERRLDGPARGLPDGLDLRRAPDKGNVAQIAELPLTGKRGHRRATLALGFGPSAGAASSTAGAALDRGFDRAADRYAAGWHAYLRGLSRPRSAAGHRTLYDVSAMVLAGLEDKTYRGAGIASPSMAWVWGTLAGYSGPYHLVWSRDLYQVATAQIAAGDRAAAERALDYLWTRQQAEDGCFPQNSNLDGSPHWTDLQLDEVADPVLLAWQLGHTDAETWSHVERAIGCIIKEGPTSQERWENTEDWYSPATIAAEIAALVCAAEIAERNGDERRRGRATARRPTTGSGRSRAGRARPTARSPRSPTTSASRPTATPTRARRTRSATAAPRSTSGASSTRASSSSCGSASSPPTTPPSARRSPWSTASSA